MSTSNENNIIFFIKIVKMLAQLMGVWPLDIGATKFRIFIYHLTWWFIVTNLAFLLLPTIISIYKSRCSIFEFSLSCMETLLIIESLVSLIVCKCQQDRIKILLHSIDNTIMHIKKHKCKKITENFMDITKLYSIIIVFYMLVIVLNFYNMSYRNLLSSAWYPFSTTHFPVRLFLLLHQFFAIFNTTVLLIVDVICFVIMYNAINQLEIIKEQYKEVRSYQELKKCVRNHQEALWYVEDLNTSLRYVIARTIFGYIGYFIIGGFGIMNANKSSTVLKQFVIIFIMNVIRLYIYADTADRISEINTQINLVIYDTLWYKQSKKMVKVLVIVMQRCQIPIKVSFSKIMPNLNMHFFSHYVYLNCSCFMTLRAIHMKFNSNEVG